jgi:Uma2 family endonuclease
MRKGAMPAHEPLVTADEFARIPDDHHRYELVEGRVVRMSPPGARHAVLATRIAALLFRFVESRRLGTVMTAGGFRLATNPDTVREPDVAVVRRERIPAAGLPEGYWPGPPDLAVEISSPHDRSSDVTSKAHEYLRYGVRLVWVADPRTRSVTVFAPAARPFTAGEGDVLHGGDVLPGFSCRVAEFFE